MLRTVLSLFFVLGASLTSPFSKSQAFTLDCQDPGVLVHKSDGYFEVVRNVANQNINILEKKLIAHVPKFIYRATAQQKTLKRGFCVCWNEWEFQQSISLKKDNFGRFKADYQVLDFVSEHTATNQDGLKKFNFNKCKSLTSRIENNTVKGLLEQFDIKVAGHLEDIKDSFKPKHTCEAPFEYLAEAKAHFGEHWEEFTKDMFGMYLLSQTDTKQFCEKQCKGTMLSGLTYCKPTDLQ